jgi:hypothetical protein
MIEEYHFSRIIAGSVAAERLWKTVEPCDRIILSASSNRGGPEVYREVFLEGARMVRAFLPAARTVFVSSTSVYGQAAGEIVTEESSAEPSTETGQILREAEDVALAGGAIIAGSTRFIATISSPRSPWSWNAARPARFTTSRTTSQSCSGISTRGAPNTLAAPCLHSARKKPAANAAGPTSASPMPNCAPSAGARFIPAFAKAFPQSRISAGGDGLGIYSPKYACRTSSLASNSAPVPVSWFFPVTMT